MSNIYLNLVRKEDPIDLDIIDEALYFFKSNVFFAHFEIMV